MRKLAVPIYESAFQSMPLYGTYFFTFGGDEKIADPFFLQVLFCRLTEEQRSLYLSYINGPDVKQILGGRLKVFMGLIALRKICNHPDLFDGGPKHHYGGNNDDDLEVITAYLQDAFL